MLVLSFKLLKWIGSKHNDIQLGLVTDFILDGITFD